MKKAEQIEINKKVLQAMHEAVEEYTLTKANQLDNDWARLNKCQACTLVGMSHWIFLKSYSTIVAAIDTDTWICYDFSRYVYGYTATTCQHIHKFANQYDADIIAYRE